ncbi:MAG: IPT/TIG domain-containing protein [Candidatus Magnetomorum sp.]|nr:IPT/TIG domain-containing protein [Candidatus Magnetomorum sp.]
MRLIYAFKLLSIMTAMIVALVCPLHAAPPIIQDFYPETVNINTSASMVIIADNLESAMTVTINGGIVQNTVNIAAKMITCTVPEMNTSGSVAFTIQNADGISDIQYLAYEDCSDWTITIPAILLDDTIERTLNNVCYSQYQYKIDDKALSPLNNISEPLHLTGLGEGSHVLIIQGKDQAQNPAPSESFSFTVDTILPEIQLENLPITVTTKTSETITVTALTVDASQYKYQLDGMTYFKPSISEPIHLTDLTPKTYTLCVIAGDRSGNWQSFDDVSCHTWTIINIAIAQQTLTPTEVLAGTQSRVFTSTYSGEDVTLAWTVRNADGGQVGSTVYGNAFSFTPPVAGAYAGIYTISMVAQANGQKIFEDKAFVKVPITIETDRYTIVKETIFRVKGTEAGATLIWDIITCENDPIDIDDPEQIGRWERVGADSLDMTFYPAPVDAITNFCVKVSVEDDADLTSDNGLHENITGPFIILPMTAFTIILSDESGFISTTTNNEITVKDMVMLKTQNLTASYSRVVFDLPDSGGTYYFTIKDNRTPPVYMDYSFSTPSKENIVVLQPVGDDIIEGSVENTEESVLNTVKIAAYPVFTDSEDQTPWHVETQTAVNGKYTVYLPDYSFINGWTVVAGQDGYASSIKTDQQLNSDILFTGTDALQPKTSITLIQPMSDKINIRATPAFTSSNQVDIKKILGDGSETYYSKIDFDNGLISVATPDTDTYTLVIKADTIENYDPGTGYVAYHAYRKNSVDSVKKREDLSIDIIGGTISLMNDNQTMKAVVPVNGISKASTLTLEQIENSIPCNATAGSQYIYGVYATNSQTGKSISAEDINRILITLPFNLRVIQPGDLENEKWFIYHADSLEKMAAHQTEKISVSAFVQSNYLGDGKTGSISFWVDHLSVFAIGKPADIAPSTPSTVLNTSNDSGGDCFIGISQKNTASGIFGAMFLCFVLSSLVAMKIRRFVHSTV